MTERRVGEGLRRDENGDPFMTGNNQIFG